MRIQPKDLAALAATYQTIIKESHGVEGRSGEPASEHIRHKDQTPYTQDDMGINTSHYKTKQPGMGKTHDVMSTSSTPTQSFEQRLLQAAQNGELTEDLVQQIVADIWDAAQQGLHRVRSLSLQPG